jgi:hypothetical protein
MLALDALTDSHRWPARAEFLTILTALLLLATALRRTKLPWPTVAIFLAGVAARFAYLSVTPFSKRGHDVFDHIEYIEYLLNHRALPDPYEGAMFYQPPLYYVLGAGLWKSLTLVGARSRETILTALQIQSVLYQLGFLVFSIWTAKLWLYRLPDGGFGRGLASRQGLLALFVALLSFWPSGVIHSVRLGNDDLLYLCFGAGVYFASRWWTAGRDRDLYVAAAWGALGMLTKSNALLLFVLLAVLLGARLAMDRERRLSVHLRRAWPILAFALVSIGAMLGRAAIDAAAGKRSNLLVGNSSRLNGDLTVGNGAANYLWFDTKIFVTQAFTSPWDDAKGRPFFWNYAAKTSLFGEFSFDRAVLSNLAVIISVLLLFLAICLAFGISLSGREDCARDLPAFVLVGTLFLSLAALRMCIPKACSNDFRYILPVLTPLIYFYVRNVTLFRRRGWAKLAIAAQAAGWSLAALSAAFFVALTALA